MTSTPYLDTDGKLTVRSGDTIALTLTHKDSSGVLVDLTDCVARLQMRVATSTDPIVDASSDDVSPIIILGGVLGTIEITISPSATINVGKNTGDYGLAITDGDGAKTTILAGKMSYLASAVHD